MLLSWLFNSLDIQLFRNKLGTYTRVNERYIWCLDLYTCHTMLGSSIFSADRQSRTDKNCCRILTFGKWSITIEFSWCWSISVKLETYFRRILTFVKSFFFVSFEGNPYIYIYSAYISNAYEYNLCFECVNMHGYLNYKVNQYMYLQYNNLKIIFKINRFRITILITISAYIYTLKYSMPIKWSSCYKIYLMRHIGIINKSIRHEQCSLEIINVHKICFSK